MFALLLQKRLWRTLPGCRLNLNPQLIRLYDCRKLWTDWDSCQAPRASPDLSWRLDVEPNPKLAPSVRPDSAPVVDLLEDLDLDRLEDEVLDSMTLMERQRQLLFLTQVAYKTNHRSKVWILCKVDVLQCKTLTTIACGVVPKPAMGWWKAYLMKLSLKRLLLFVLAAPCTSSTDLLKTFFPRDGALGAAPSVGAGSSSASSGS